MFKDTAERLIEVFLERLPTDGVAPGTSMIPSGGRRRETLGHRHLLRRRC